MAFGNIFLNVYAFCALLSGVLCRTIFYTDLDKIVNAFRPSKKVEARTCATVYIDTRMAPNCRRNAEVLTNAMKQTLSLHAPQHPRKLTTLNKTKRLLLLLLQVTTAATTTTINTITTLNRTPTDTKIKGRSATTTGDDDDTSGLSRSSRLVTYGRRLVLKYSDEPTATRLKPISCTFHKVV